ncbi:MAG: oxidative damage protection protein [Chromatiales bacterium]|mgnify:CR=1 FL=1|jgi:Fe-S cluster biosynthesis and repair protein YggX|nr:oxidative damage protection protein [Chromatiales bacterium]
MARNVFCSVLKREATGLEEIPHPGELGRRIYDNVSEEGWGQWLERLQMIINENQLNTGDPKAMALIEDHMLGFFFDEGDLGGVPMGFQAGAARKK